MILQKEYSLKISLPNKQVQIFFKQYTAYECMEYIQTARKEGFNVLIWAFEFINSCKSDKPWYRKNNLTKKEFSKIKNLEWLVKIILDSLFDRTGKAKWDGEWIPESASLIALSEKIGIDPMEILKKYTYDQIDWLYEWLEYYWNMQSEEGQKRNEQKKIIKQIEEAGKDWEKELQERLDKLWEWNRKNT